MPAWGSVPLRVLGEVLHVSKEQLAELVKGLEPERGLSAEPLYAWADLAPRLSRKAIVAMQREAREARMRMRTSKRWVSGYPHLVAEWHRTRNHDLFPDEVTFGAHKRIWWQCPASPDHEWQAVAKNRVNGTTCPFCDGRRASRTNSLAALGSRELLSEWDKNKNAGLTPEHVVAESHERVWWKCPRALDHEWQEEVRIRFHGRGCPFCKGVRPSVTNNLAMRARALAKSWHPTKNGALKPRHVVVGSHRRVWWRCPEGPDHEWQASVKDRARGAPCPFCANRRLSATNSLAAKHPDLAREWDAAKNKKAATAVRASERTSVWWRCKKDPAHVWRAPVRSRAQRGTGCPFCTGRHVTVATSFAARFPVLAREWDTSRNGALSPRDVTGHSHRVVFWKCPKGEDHRWQAACHERAAHPRCPFCDGKRASRTTSLAARAPRIARHAGSGKSEHLNSGKSERSAKERAR